MFNWDTFRELKDFYSAVFGPAYLFDHDHHHVSTNAAGLGRLVEVAKNDLGFLLLNTVSVARVKGHPMYAHRSTDCEWDVTYHLFQLESHQRLQVHVLLSPEERLPSVQEWFPSARAAEHAAMMKIRGEVAHVTPLSLPTPTTNPNLSEKPYPHELHQWYLFDLCHPVTRGEGELAVETDEGRVISSIFQTGHWRRGWEDMASQKTPLQMAPLLEGLHPEAAPITNVAWSKTIEDFFLWRIPERAQAVRMLFMELGRCHHHLSVLARLAVDLEQAEAVQVCRETVERLRSVFQLYGGSRVATGLTAFGGLPHDLPPGWMQECASVLESLKSAHKLYHRLVLRNPLCQRRLGHAGLTSQQALQAGLTGPSLRAAGVNFDLRKSRPFYFYADIDFDVPVGMRGTAHDRGLLLCEEIRQSVRILGQVLDNLPLGAFIADQDGLKEFNRGILPHSRWQEWWRGADRAWGAQWTAVEGADGELGFHVLLHPESQNLQHLHIKTNAIQVAQVVPLVLQSCPVSQVGPAMTSLAISASAVDR